MLLTRSASDCSTAQEKALRFPRQIVAPIAGGLLLVTFALLLAQPRPARASSTFSQVDTTYTYTAYLPVVTQTPPWIDISTRQTVLDYYANQYLTSDGVPIVWSGDLNSCNAGDTSPVYRAAITRRINYYRAMAGVPAIITLNDTYNQKAQAAALMMSRNNALNHTPPNTWLCYSAIGYAGASSSNIALGASGPAAISLYMRDNGSGNTASGHRRWILYPQTQQMGTGDIPATSGYWAANALVVFDDHTWDTRPATRDAFVAWPPPGYVPYPVVYARWTFAYAGADFSSATVSMDTGATNLAVSVSTPQNGYGENTLVWIPMGLNDGSNWPQPTADTTYHITVSNVIISGQPHSFSYNVIIFDSAK
jgi:uncharacterized protein YkwD